MYFTNVRDNSDPIGNLAARIEDIRDGERIAISTGESATRLPKPPGGRCFLLPFAPVVSIKREGNPRPRRRAVKIAHPVRGSDAAPVTSLRA